MSTIRPAGRRGLLLCALWASPILLLGFGHYRELRYAAPLFPALALALEPSATDVMKRPPRDPREPLMTPRFVWLITWQGLLLTGVVLLGFLVGMLTRHAGPLGVSGVGIPLSASGSKR